MGRWCPVSLLYFAARFHQLSKDVQNFRANLAVVFGQQAAFGGIVEIRVTKQDAVFPSFSLFLCERL